MKTIDFIPQNSDGIWPSFGAAAYKDISPTGNRLRLIVDADQLV